ncbi:MAG: 1-acyl-sn-glycerol-3-phosphate acyltransferase [Oscillospiraceae bacterium]|nr:1-acyl-sn-glycerol-3-phosphate acyltransferase [Oscillospiraceae bacterium]
MLYHVVVFLVRIAMYIWYDLHIEGRENIPKGRAFVYASNHRSYADPVLVSISGRGRFSFMAKSELFEKPLFAWLIRGLGAFPVERGKGDTAAIDRAVANVQHGTNLLIFPEGTRSKDGRVGRGKTGVALIAARAKADVVPVGISFVGKLHFRSKVTVRIGEPIPAATLAVEDGLTDRELLRKLKSDVVPPIMDAIRGLVDVPPALPDDAGKEA